MSQSSTVGTPPAEIDPAFERIDGGLKLRVLIDLELSHASGEHPRFAKSRQSRRTRPSSGGSCRSTSPQFD